MATAVGSTIGALRVVIGADTTGLQRGLRDTNKGMAGLRRAIVPTVAAVAALGAAFTAVAATMYGMARAEMNVIDSQAKLARSIGGTVTGLRAMKMAAEDNGIDGLESSLNRMNRRLGAVEMAGGPAAATVERLGLNIKDLAQMDIDERLASIADSIRDSGISAQEAARHLQQLGFQQAEATTFFMQGGDAIREARDRVEDFGLAVSMISAAQIEEANTQLSRMQTIAQGLRTQLAVRLAPTLLEISSRFANVAQAALAALTQVDDLDDAARSMGSNTSLVEFARISGEALARLVDYVRLLRNALHAFEGYAKAWAASTIRTIATPFEGLVRLGAKVNEDMFSDQVEFFDNLKRTQEEGWEQGKQGWDDFWEHIRDGQGSALSGFQEAWARELPAITVQGNAGGEDGAGALGAFGADGASSEDQQAQELERRREFLEQRLQMLREFVASEMELEMFQHETKLEQLRELWEEGIIPTEEEFMELREELEEEHWDRITAIRERAEQDHIRNVQRAAQMENQLRQGVAQHAIGLLDQLAGKSKAAALASIVLNKAVAMARVAQTTAEAAMLAYASQLVPGDPSSIGRAAAAAAKAKALGAVQMGLIAATGIAQAAGAMSSGASLSGGASGSIGGRSSAPSSSAGSIVAPEEQRRHTAVTINLQGEVFGRQQVRDLIEKINEATEAGATLRLES